MDRLSPIQGEDDEQELRIPFKIKGGCAIRCGGF